MKSFIGRRSALGTLLLISSLLVPSQSKADLEGAYESQSDLKEYCLKTCLELEYNPPGKQSYPDDQGNQVSLNRSWIQWFSLESDS